MLNLYSSAPAKEAYANVSCCWENDGQWAGTCSESAAFDRWRHYCLGYGIRCRFKSQPERKSPLTSCSTPTTPSHHRHVDRALAWTPRVNIESFGRKNEISEGCLGAQRRRANLRIGRALVAPCGRLFSRPDAKKAAPPADLARLADRGASLWSACHTDAPYWRWAASEDLTLPAPYTPTPRPRPHPTPTVRIHHTDSISCWQN